MFRKTIDHDSMEAPKLQKNKERLRNDYRLWELKEKQKLNIMWDPDSILVQKKDNIGKSGERSVLWQYTNIVCLNYTMYNCTVVNC